MITDMTNGPALLETWIAASGLMNQEVASRLGVDRMALYYWRTGQRRPTLKSRQAIADLTDGAVPASSWQ